MVAIIQKYKMNKKRKREEEEAEESDENTDLKTGIISYKQKLIQDIIADLSTIDHNIELSSDSIEVLNSVFVDSILDLNCNSSEIEVNNIALFSKCKEEEEEQEEMDKICFFNFKERFNKDSDKYCLNIDFNNQFKYNITKSTEQILRIKKRKENEDKSN